MYHLQMKYFALQLLCITDVYEPQISFIIEVIIKGDSMITYSQYTYLFPNMSETC